MIYLLDKEFDCKLNHIQKIVSEYEGKIYEDLETKLRIAVDKDEYRRKNGPWTIDKTPDRAIIYLYFNSLPTHEYLTSVLKTALTNAHN